MSGLWLYVNYMPVANSALSDFSFAYIKIYDWFADILKWSVIFEFYLKQGLRYFW